MFGLISKKAVLEILEMSRAEAEFCVECTSKEVLRSAETIDKLDDEKLSMLKSHIENEFLLGMVWAHLSDTTRIRIADYDVSRAQLNALNEVMLDINRLK